MFIAERVNRAAVSAASTGLYLACMMIAGVSPACLDAQQAAQSAQATLPAREPGDVALPLPEDRGQVALEQDLRRLVRRLSLFEKLAKLLLVNLG